MRRRYGCDDRGGKKKSEEDLILAQTAQSSTVASIKDASQPAPSGGAFDTEMGEAESLKQQHLASRLERARRRRKELSSEIEATRKEVSPEIEEAGAAAVPIAVSDSVSDDRAEDPGMRI